MRKFYYVWMHGRTGSPDDVVKAKAISAKEARLYVKYVLGFRTGKVLTRTEVLAALKHRNLPERVASNYNEFKKS